MSMLDELVDAFTVLPGVGPKSAQRMALHLLERNRSGGKELASLIELSMEKIGHCTRCQTLSENPLCQVCIDSRRDQRVVCVVENPSDVMAIEQSQSFRGGYFVLRGNLSPLDGIGPDQLGLPVLFERLANEEVEEVIIATSATVEGEATAYYLAERIADMKISVSRIAHGIPIGGELEYIDGNTLSRAIEGRYSI